MTKLNYIDRIRHEMKATITGRCICKTECLDVFMNKEDILLVLNKHIVRAVLSLGVYTYSTRER